MEPASHLNITANRDDYDTYTDVQKILKEIKPNWKKENIEIQVKLYLSEQLLCPMIERFVKFVDRQH